MGEEVQLTEAMMAADPSIIKARYWEPESNGRLRCTLCPRSCSLADGQRGLCFVRGRIGDKMVMTTWGRSSGFCIDPIEKKPLSHFLPGSAVLSFGTAGCNLTCKFCQNWDISKSRAVDKLQELASPAAIAMSAKQTGCQSVAYTYNDPVIFLEYAVAIAEECHKLGVKNVAVTAGYISDGAREEFFERMDAVNLDIKAFSVDFYRKLCTADLESVKKTALYLARKKDCWLEITTLLIPDANDSDEELKQYCRWYLEELGPHIPLHFTAFHPDYKLRDRGNTPLATLQRARAIARDQGIHHVYCGNVHDKESATTFCPQCHSPLIVRDWHQLLAWNLGQGGHCQQCGTALAGVFADKPGGWGGKRMRVNVPKMPLPPPPEVITRPSMIPPHIKPLIAKGVFADENIL